MNKWHPFIPLQDDAAKVSDALDQLYGAKEIEDIKFLSDKDMKKLQSRCGLLKAPAGKLMDCWKSAVGIAEGPDVAPDWMQDATYIDHARKLLTQIYYRQNMVSANARLPNP